jgi:membrane associated rhomboid family serine protease
MSVPAAPGEAAPDKGWLSSRFAPLGILVLANVGVFVLEIVTAPFSGALDGDLVVHGGVNSRLVDDGEWWRIVTAGFLHSGLTHLVGNMIALVILGGVLTLAVGPMRMCLLYATGLLSSSLAVIVLSPNSLAVGASGAIFGLAGGALLLAWRQKRWLLLAFAAVWIAYTLSSTLFVPGISQAGHLGGLAGGALMGWLLVGPEAKLREGRTTMAIAAGILALLFVVAILA